ncbi:sulfatase-like hydrolase/transferase [Nocardia sp. CA-151230]|uniref:sulfatase-like hydrolase/transferase n=1 Tax=Nocardia sp. CA-151230 TaxID=3239982 RepID=UPI003D8BFA4E
MTMPDTPFHAGVTRRAFLGAAAAAAATAALAPGVLARAEPGRRPNILCLVSEDCGAQHLGCYGGVAQTPTLDRLAAEGVRWRNCFSSAPVCAPSRFSLITGMESESCAPANQMRAAGALPPFLDGAGWPRLLRQAGYYCTNNAKEDYNTADLNVAATWDESSPHAHWRNRPPGAPFFAIFNPVTTHESSVFLNAPGLDRLDGAMSTPYLQELQAVHAVTATPILGGPTTPGEVRIPPYYPDTPTTRSDAALYMNQINQMDQEMAARLRELDDAGLAEDTIVFYYSDHGGVLPRSKRFCYDSGLHIPLIARFGGNVAELAPAPPGSTLDEPVCSGTALPPTILDLTGVGAATWMGGAPFAGPRRAVSHYAFGMRNRMDERYDMVRTARDERFRYIRNYLPHLPNGQHVQFMWLQAGYREWDQLHHSGNLDEIADRFWNERPAEELYDTTADPDEIHNLADDPAYAEDLQRLRTALDEHMLAVVDDGFIPESEAAEGYTAGRAPGAYPLREIMTLTANAIRRDPAGLPELIRNLNSGNEIVRYWAATGCCMLDAGAAPAAADLRAAFDTEPSPHTKIALAEALARVTDNPQPVEYLGATLTGHPDGWIQLQAANALDHLGPRALPARSQLVKASTGAGAPIAADAAGHVRTATAHTVRALDGTGAGVP